MQQYRRTVPDTLHRSTANTARTGSEPTNVHGAPGSRRAAPCGAGISDSDDR